MARGKYEAIMLKEVSCRGYLREARDSVHIEQDILEEEYDSIFSGEAEAEPHFYLIDKDGERRPLTVPGDGGEKQYYVQEDKPFTGVCVGVKNITVRAKLFYGERQNEKGDTLSTFVGKQPLEVKQCALVYYANMRKRLVPLNLIEIEEEKDDNSQLTIPGIDVKKKSTGIPIEDIIPEEKPCVVVIKKEDDNTSFTPIEDDPLPF